MFNKELTDKIDKFLHKNFNIIYDFKFDGLILLFGGAVKDIIMDRKIKDLDFILLTQGNGNILEFIDKYNLKYKKNIYYGHKIDYNGINVDITCVNDLYEAGHLSTDFLFYDIKRKVLIPIGIKYSIKKNMVIDYYYQGYYKPKVRIKKAKMFLYFLNKKGNPKVKYRYNRLFYLIKAVIVHPSKLFRGNKKC